MSNKLNDLILEKIIIKLYKDNRTYKYIFLSENLDRFDKLFIEIENEYKILSLTINGEKPFYIKQTSCTIL
jgi:hypothetical protein